MLNMLVVEDNIYYSKLLINTLLKNNEKLRLFGISTNGEEALNIIKADTNLDIILLDLKLPKYSGIDILNFIKEHKLTKYYGSIIVISSEMDLISQIRQNPYICSCVSKICGLDVIQREIESLINFKQEEKESIEYKVRKELGKLHYNSTHIGTQYMLESILIIYYNKDTEIKLEKNIYNIISKKYNKSVLNIKTNILHATDIMYFDCEKSILNEYFCCAAIKPTPKEIIYTILSKLENE